MAQSPHIFEGREDNFASVVLANSRRVPVLVDFWAAWCAPCQMLMPILAKLADEYQGKFILAKVNTDEQPQLARQYGIRSLPTVRLFKDDKVVDEIMGAVPESTVRKLLDKHIMRESDRMRAAAQAAYQRGDANQALSLLQKAAQSDPDNFKVRLDLARILFEQGACSQVEAILSALPREARDDPQVSALQGMMEFARAVEHAPATAELEAAVRAAPRNSEVRYQLSARKVLRGDYQGALDHLLEILRTDPGFRDRARNAMVAIFNLLGGKGDLVSRYRTQMFNAMH